VGGVTEVGGRRVVVVGAGIVGIACALHLQRRDCRVTVVDRLPPGEGASFGNAGVLAASSVVPVPTPGLVGKVPSMLMDPLGPLYLRWSYLPRLLPWLAPYLRQGRADAVTRIAAGLAPLLFDSVEQHRALAGGTKAEKWLHPSDYLYLFSDREKFEGDGLLWDLRRRHGAVWETLDRAAIQDLVPGTGPKYRFGALMKNHGMISDPGRYVKDLAETLVGNGGRLVRAEARGFAFAGDGTVGVETTEGSVNGDAVVIAAGAWSARLAERLGHRIPLESERGYHVELENPSVVPPMPVMMNDGKCVATPMAGGLRIAGLVEFAGLDAPPNPRPPRVLIERARRLFPGLTFEGHREWLGHRPATTDSLPVLGRSHSHPNVFFAFGHHHVGLTGGPKTGRLIAELITGSKPNFDLSPYRVDRFGQKV
jgi:D-amino-acid dehydrogenase